VVLDLAAASLAVSFQPPTGGAQSAISTTFMVVTAVAAAATQSAPQRGRQARLPAVNSTRQPAWRSVQRRDRHPRDPERLARLDLGFLEG
jgi:hypothetical protein